MCPFKSGGLSIFTLSDHFNYLSLHLTPPPPHPLKPHTKEDFLFRPTLHLILPPILSNQALILINIKTTYVQITINHLDLFSGAISIEIPKMLLKTYVLSNWHFLPIT